MSFATTIFCVASQRAFINVIDFVIDSVRKLLDTPSYQLMILFYGNWVQFLQG